MNVILSQPNTLLFVCAVGVILLLLFWLIRLERKVRKLFCGDMGNETALLGTTSARATEALGRIKRLEVRAEQTEKRVSRSVQGIETVRFNPFKESGSGNQSFASAFLSENGDGVVISTLYSRDRVGVFGKPIVNFSSPFDLTEEEAGAMRKAAEKIAGTKR